MADSWVRGLSNRRQGAASRPLPSLPEGAGGGSGDRPAVEVQGEFSWQQAGQVPLYAPQPAPRAARSVPRPTPARRSGHNYHYYAQGQGSAGTTPASWDLQAVWGPLSAHASSASLASLDSATDLAESVTSEVEEDPSDSLRQPLLSGDRSGRSGGSGRRMSATEPPGGLAGLLEGQQRWQRGTSSAADAEEEHLGEPDDSDPKLRGLHVAGVFISQMCAAIQVTLPFTIAVYMVRNFGFTDEQDIDRLSGLLPSLFCLGQFLSAFWWGSVSDRAGRKLVVILGNLLSSVCLVLFGMSGAYWQAALMQVVAGICNGVSGALFAMAGESFDEGTQAQLLLYMSIAWGLGTTLGPVLGGFLSNPCDLFPEPFPFCNEGELFVLRPFLLPYLTAAAITFLAFLMSFFMDETLRRHQTVFVRKEEAAEVDLAGPVILKRYVKTKLVLTIEEDDSEAELPYWKVPSVVLSIIGTSAYAGLYTAWDEINPIYASNAVEVGGLHLSPNQLGLAMSLGGVALALYAALLYRPMLWWLGVKRLTRAALVLDAGVMMLWPAAALVLTDSKVYSLAFLCTGYILRAMTDNSIITSSAMMVNLVAPSDHLGAVNGMNQMCVSFCRMAGPTLGGLAWGAAVRAELPFHSYAIYGTLAAGLFATSFVYGRSLSIPNH